MHLKRFYRLYLNTELISDAVAKTPRVALHSETHKIIVTLSAVFHFFQFISTHSHSKMYITVQENSGKLEGERKG